MEAIFKDFLEAISPALQTLIVTLVTVLLGQLTLYLKTQYGLAKAKLSTEQQLLLDILAERAVQTVEQLYNSAPNVVKRDNAIEIIEATLEKAGLSVDANAVLEAVEAQVFKKNAVAPKG